MSRRHTRLAFAARLTLSAAGGAALPRPGEEREDAVGMAGIDLLEAARPPEQAAVDLVTVVARILGDVADFRRVHEPAPGGQLPRREQIGAAASAVAVVPAVAVAARVWPARLLAARSPITRPTSLAPAGRRLA